MAAKMTTEAFILKAKQVHRDLYDYSSVTYTNTNTPVSIVCAKHGRFSQLPKIHLKGCHCPRCAIEQHPSHAFLTTDEFIRRSTLTHGTTYNYDRVTYTTARDKVDIGCTVCGHTFSMVPAVHIYGQGCPKCGSVAGGKKCRLTQQQFIDRLRQRYGTKLTYDRVNFVKLSQPVIVTCTIHNLEFSMIGAYLLDNKVSCPECSRALKQRPHLNRAPGPGKYHVNRTTLKNSSDPAIVYVLRLTKGDETFYKVGVTVQTTARRACHMKSSGYTIEIVHEYHTTLVAAIAEENRILNEKASHRYLPRTKFGGYTECLSLDPYAGKPRTNNSSALPTAHV